MSHEPREYNVGPFGRTEETVLETDPTTGYKKTRIVLLGQGYEYLDEEFQGDIIDKRSLTIKPEEGIQRVELSRIDGKILIILNDEGDNQMDNAWSITPS